MTEVNSGPDKVDVLGDMLGQRVSPVATNALFAVVPIDGRSCKAATSYSGPNDVKYGNAAEKASNSHF